jgi:hypothetical protein
MLILFPLEIALRGIIYKNHHVINALLLQFSQILQCSKYENKKPKASFHILGNFCNKIFIFGKFLTSNLVRHYSVFKIVFA